METGTSRETVHQIGHCPECGTQHAFRQRLLVGELMPCDQCGKELEVAGLRPLILQRLAKVEADEEDFAR